MSFDEVKIAIFSIDNASALDPVGSRDIFLKNIGIF